MDLTPFPNDLQASAANVLHATGSTVSTIPHFGSSKGRKCNGLPPTSLMAWSIKVPAMFNKV
jgi:hypothetical protein